MKTFKGQLFILLIIYIHNSSGVLNDLYDTGEELWKLYLLIDEMGFKNVHSVEGLLRDNSFTYQKMKNQMNEIRKKFDRMEELMNPKTIRASFKSWPFNLMLYRSIDSLEIFISSIDEYYKKFHQYMNESDFYPHSFPNITQTILNVEEKIYMIRQIVVSKGGILLNQENVVSSISDSATTQQSHLCDSPQIISSVLVKLFRMVIIAEMKANIILTFTSTHKYHDTIGWRDTFTKELLEKQFGIYVNLFSINMRITDEVYVRACEPDGGMWIRNGNFYELEGTFQTTIFRYHWGNIGCMFENCNDALSEKQNKCDVKYYDNRSGCSGTQAQCTGLNDVQACVLKTGPYKFQYVNSSKIGLLGKNFKCPKDNGYIIEDGSGWNSTYSTCACNCFRDHNKISLLIMESRVASNMVITGLRFVRKDNILYIQPREGRLGANGYISPYSERWISIPKDTSSQTHSIDRENRIFFLDDFHLGPGHILTGVRFNKVIRGTVIGFAIQIFGLPFDYESGQLNLNSKILSEQGWEAESPQPVPFERINPLGAPLPLLLSPSIKRYVSLERSRLRDDFGQSTLPLFDAVPIVTPSSSPLGGIGIFHKAQQGYAGFISLRVYGIKYAKYFTDFEAAHVKYGKVLFNHSQSD